MPLTHALAHSPVIPLGDGTWIPTLPPWAEGNGPTSLLTDGEKYWTHGTFMARDGLGTPLYAAFCEVLAPDEMMTDHMLNYQADLIHMRNVGFSQPYLQPARLRLHLQRGEVKAFLKTYYNGFAGLADRETYTFWEHYFHASPHKTHEEAWFLMQTRWMLWLEQGDTLRLLAGIPRAWLEHGKHDRACKMSPATSAPSRCRWNRKSTRGRSPPPLPATPTANRLLSSCACPTRRDCKATAVTGGDYNAGYRNRARLPISPAKPRSSCRSVRRQQSAVKS